MKKIEDAVLTSLDNLAKTLTKGPDEILKRDARINELTSVLLKVLHRASRKLYIETELLNEIKEVLK